MSLPTDALTALASAGWTPDRRVDIDADVAALENEGYQIWPAVTRFLESFTRLDVRFQRWSGLVDDIWFDATKAAVDRDKGWVDDYSMRIGGVRLVPVGCAGSDHLLVMLAEDGRFFGGYDDFFLELASDPVDLIGSLIDERHVGGST